MGRRREEPVADGRFRVVILLCSKSIRISTTSGKKNAVREMNG